MMDDYAAVMANPVYEYPSSSTTVSGTSDLFSSTFAMLSDTAPAYIDPQWAAPEKIHGAYYYDTPAPAMAEDYTRHMDPYEQPLDLRFDNYRPPIIPNYDAYQPLTIQPQTHYLDQQMNIGIQQHHSHLPQPSTLLRRVKASDSPVPLPSTQQRTLPQTITPPHNNNNQSPHAGNSSPEEILLQATDCEIGDDERVMCMACRGVYPSRRSLTGHIGRNEKCREIIGLTQPASTAPPTQWNTSSGSSESGNSTGRNYLDQLALHGNIPPPPGTESAKAGAITNGQDGLSPICPYCDRFISHYKGNIRRHINQCGKTGGKRAKNPKHPNNPKRIKKDNEWGHDSMMQMQGYDHMIPSASLPSMPTTHISPPPLTMSMSEIIQPPPIMHPAAVSNSMQTQLNDSNNATPSIKKEPEVPDDPYLCPYCDFLTVYKGNMKRHMNTCHVHEPDCKDRKLDNMKASVLGVDPITLVEKINAHKANSTRGRRPKSKKEQDNQCLMSPSLSNGRNSGGSSSMGSMHDYDDMGYYSCPPSDPYVGYQPMPMMPRMHPMLPDEPSDPLQATINHVAEAHRL